MSPTVLILLLLVASAFFSASELAIFWTPLYKIKQLVNNWKSKTAELLLKLRNNSEKTLITILIGNNFVNVLVSIYAAQLWDWIIRTLALSASVGLIVVPVVITFLILLFWEIIPKVFATKYSLKFALFVSRFVRFLYYILSPIVLVLEFFIKILNKIFKWNEEKVSSDDIETFVDDWKKQWLFSDSQSKIIKNLLNFHELSAENVFRHRTKMLSLSIDLTVEKAIHKILQNPYSRIPVYKWDNDNVVGILTIRDALRLTNSDPDYYQKKLSEITLRPVFRIPITANIFEVFLKMKKSWHHFAIVLDEYWWTAWILTFEDILEEMVWDIKDEFDLNEEKDILKLDDNILIVRWDVLLKEVLNALEIQNYDIPDEIVENISKEDEISYIILSMLKEFAKKWDIVMLWQLKLKVVEISDKKNSIQKVKVEYMKKNS